MGSSLEVKPSPGVAAHSRNSIQFGESHETTIVTDDSSHLPRRNISGVNLVSAAFNICNSWTAVATTIAIAIAAGGTFTLIYGIIIVAVAYISVALTLAELASVYPTAGGQYHFASILAPKKLNRGISYVCGFAAVCSWIFLSAAVTILEAQILLSFPAYYVEGFEPQTWHYFLVFQAINVTIHIYNLFLLKKTIWIHEVGFFLSLLMFVTVVIACLVRAKKQPSYFVWENFQNTAGWPDGITFLTGLVTPGIMFGGLDGALHLAEECLSPERTVPKAVILTSVIGTVTGLVFSIVMSYGITDLDELLTTTMPIYTLWRQALRSPISATVFLVGLLFVVLFAINAIVQTASRMIWAFAQDGGLLGSKHLGAIHLKLKVPTWALIMNAAVVSILGCIYLGSTVAFNAVAGSCIILQMFSFSIPTILLMLQRRSKAVLPSNRFFKLPTWLGWCVNCIVVLFAIIEIVFFNFPPALPTTGETMNYASVVLVVTVIFAGVNWLLHAKTRYQGPKISWET